MNPRQHRPIGVTLLALAFLWIGIGGTLFFPILALTGTTSALGRFIFGSRIASEPFLKFLWYAFQSIWYLAYIAYAVIGFGLWKLKNWARKSVLVINVLCTVAALIAAVGLVRPVVMGLSIVGAALVEFGWIAWYLMRPRVQYAFGAWNRFTSNGEWIEPPALLNGKKIAIGFLVPASIVVLFGIPLLFAADSMMRRSGAYKLTMSTAAASPCVTSALGKPLESTWMTTGSITESSDGGSAELSIPVKGSKGKGALDVEAKKSTGGWKIESLVFTHGNVRSGLIHADSEHPCQ